MADPMFHRNPKRYKTFLLDVRELSESLDYRSLHRNGRLQG